MSIKLMTLVFDHYPAGGNELLLALVMADFANDRGAGIWPSVATLSRKTRQSRRTVQGLLRHQERIGFLGCVRRSVGGKSNEWRIQLDFFDDCAKFAPSVKPRKIDEPNRAIFNAELRNSSAPKPPDPLFNPPPYVGGGGLIFPILPVDEHAAITAVIEGLSTTTAQQILDEIAGNIRAGAIRRSAAALARELARRARAGTFLPELGLPIAVERAGKGETEAQKIINIAKRNAPRDPKAAVTGIAAAKSAVGLRA